MRFLSWLLLFSCSARTIEVPLREVVAPVVGGGAPLGGGPTSGGRPEFLSCEGVRAYVPEGPSECGCSNSRELCSVGPICTWNCSRCSVGSPCPTGWECDRIVPPFCEGVCRQHLPPCLDAGAPVELRVVVWSCREPPCELRHVIVDGGILCLSAGVAQFVPMNTQQLAADISAITCRRSADFLAESCLSVQALLVTRLQDGGMIEFGTASAIQPPNSFARGAVPILTACQSAFANSDAGLVRLNWAGGW